MASRHQMELDGEDICRHSSLQKMVSRYEHQLASTVPWRRHLQVFPETVRGIGISWSEVKFLDVRRTNCCRSICQECFHSRRRAVRGWKTMRYRPSSNHERCQEGIRWSWMEKTFAGTVHCRRWCQDMSISLHTQFHEEDICRHSSLQKIV